MDERLMMVEGLREEVQQVEDSQSEILARLDLLLDKDDITPLGKWSDGLATLMSTTGRIEKRVDEGFDDRTTRVVAQHGELLVENRHLNQVTNLNVKNLAVFDRRGEYDFYQPGGNGALGSLLQDQGAKKETVTAITLEDLFKENHIDQVDYLKLDVEGAEYPILLDCPAETLQRTRHLVLEYHEFEGAPWGPQDLERHLCLHGFQVSREPGLVGHNKLFGTGIMLARRE